MIKAARTSETSVDNYFTRQYIPEDNSENQMETYAEMVAVQGLPCEPAHNSNDYLIINNNYV
jgi:hypothetical protein